jgi:sec-independent protein translocase protein TatC
LNAAVGAQRARVDLINLSPAGGFVVAFQVALYGGAVLASPFIFYFVAAFVFPALKLHERKYVYRGLAIGVGLFLAGVAFCYLALMPVALAAAQLYSQWLGFGAFQWRAEDYISFVCKFMLGMGLGFELPVVILTLVKIGVFSYRTLSRARRYMIVINLILGAVLTTPEPITQLVMFIPLQALYEITVWIAWYWDWKAQKRALHPADSA